VAAKVDQELCTGCGACASACPFDAISFQDGTARIDENRCAGCAICARECPSDAIAVG